MTDTTTPHDLGPPPLIIDRVSVHAITTHPENPNDGDVPAIAQSLAENAGQYVPIVVQQSTGFIIKGNHTYLAAKSLGWEYIDVVFRDCDDIAAKRIMVGDNHLSSLGVVRQDALVALLLELQAAEALAGTGFDDTSLADLVRRVSDPDNDIGRGANPAPALGDLTHSLVIACTDEQHQGVLLGELLARGLDVRPVML